MFSRRNFLKYSAYFLGLSLATPTYAYKQIRPFVEEDSNPDMIAELDGIVGLGCPVKHDYVTPFIYNKGLLNLHNSYYGDRYQFNFRDEVGNYNDKMLSSMNWFFRCNYDGKTTNMDISVYELLNYISKFFNDPVIHINSGYRTHEYNKILSKKNENVAKNSLHIQGKAVDFYIPGIPIKEVCQVALYARNQVGYGGVGYYPRSGFVHIDSGTQRSWAR